MNTVTKGNCYPSMYRKLKIVHRYEYNSCSTIPLDNLKQMKSTPRHDSQKPWQAPPLSKFHASFIFLSSIFLIPLCQHFLVPRSCDYLHNLNIHTHSYLSLHHNTAIMDETEQGPDYVTLISNDGFEFKIQRSSALLSGAITRMLNPKSMSTLSRAFRSRLGFSCGPPTDEMCFQMASWNPKPTPASLITSMASSWKKFVNTSTTMKR